MWSLFIYFSTLNYFLPKEKVNEFNGKQRAEAISNDFKDLSLSVGTFRENINSTIQEALEYNKEKCALCQSLLEKLNVELVNIESRVVLLFHALPFMAHSFSRIPARNSPR
jgi:hypothetical protein